MKGVRLAVATNDPKMASDLAHGLKSTSATLGLERVTSICTTIETKTALTPETLNLVSRLEDEIVQAQTWLARRSVG